MYVFSENEQGTVDGCFANSGEQAEGRHVVPFKVYVVGDLAFYATALGKDGSSGQHCYLCNIPRLELQSPEHKKGELWSLQKLQTTYESLDDSTKRVQGVVGKPLIDCVDVDQYLPPLMHKMMGTENVLLDSILDAINKVEGLKDTPACLQNKRHDFMTKKREYNELKEMHLLWSDYGGSCLANLHLAHSTFIHIIAVEGKHWEKSKRALAIEDKDAMATEISELVTEKKRIEKIIKDTNAELSVVR